MESKSYVLSFRMVFLCLVTTGWIFDISLCENSIKSVKNYPEKNYLRRWKELKSRITLYKSVVLISPIPNMKASIISYLFLNCSHVFFIGKKMTWFMSRKYFICILYVLWIALFIQCIEFVFVLYLRTKFRIVRKVKLPS